MDASIANWGAAPVLVPMELHAEIASALLPLDGLDLERAAAWLAPAERAEYAGLGCDRRRREWLAARVCLKQLLLGEGRIADPCACELRKDAQGRPHLAFRDGRPDSPPDCSIAHKGAYALAAFARQPGRRIGADIELVSRRLPGLTDAFVHAGDALRPETAGLERLAALWVMKEAASKVLGLGLGVGLGSLMCHEDCDKLCWIHAESHCLQARYQFWHGYAVAVAAIPA